MQKKKTVKRTRQTTKAPVRKTSSGHRLLFSFLFFLAAVVLAACMNWGTKPAEGTETEKSLTVTERVAETVREVTGIGEDREEETKSAKSDKMKEKVFQTKEKTAREDAKASNGKAKDSAKKNISKTPVSEKGRLVVVIDDGGRDLASQRVYENMGIPLTLAVMPNQPHTREAAAEWAGRGLPVIIHQPMENVAGSGMEPIVILTTMTAEDMQKILRDSMSQIPEAIGMNNHQGSKATIHRPTMNVVMKELSSHGLFFFDSATNTTTVADSAAANYGVRYARNELFVDNSADTEDIKAMIRKGAELAKERGTAIIIGHCRPHTAEAFRQMVPVLQKEGIMFIYLSDVEK